MVNEYFPLVIPSSLNNNVITFALDQINAGQIKQHCFRLNQNEIIIHKASDRNIFRVNASDET